MFKGKRVREHVSNRTRIFARMFYKFLLVYGFEFNFIEAGRDSRLQGKINPIQQCLFWFGDRVFRITRLFFDETQKRRFEIVRNAIANSGVRYSLGLPVVTHVRTTGLCVLKPQSLSADSYLCHGLTNPAFDPDWRIFFPRTLK